MKKFIMLVVFLLCFVCLNGCSKDEVKSDESVNETVTAEENEEEATEIATPEPTPDCYDASYDEEVDNLGERELDFKSIYDTVTGAVISMGDPKKYVDGVLGESEYSEDYESDVYEEREVFIQFINCRAINIGVDSKDFEILGYRKGMTEEEVAEIFECEDSNEQGALYSKNYDTDGNECALEEAVYKHVIIFEAGEFYCLYITSLR